MNVRNLLLTAAVAALASAALASQASAQTISDPSGKYTVGIGANGELYDPGSGVGFLRNADGFDPLAPGTPRDSWGITTAGGSAYADQSNFGASNIVSSIKTLTASGAKVVTTTSTGMQITQNYNFVSGNFLTISTMVTNLTESTTDVQFQRNVDWDVSPTAFNENTVGPFTNGATPQVTDSTANGFENPDPAVPYGFSCFAGCNDTEDLGGGIKVDLGYLGSGQSLNFIYVYGTSGFAESLSGGGPGGGGLVGQAFDLGATYVIGTQSSENGQFDLAPFGDGSDTEVGDGSGLGSNSALIGFGMSYLSAGSVPEPTSWAMMLTGFLGLGALVRRRRAVAALA